MKTIKKFIKNQPFLYRCLHPIVKGGRYFVFAILRTVLFYVKMGLRLIHIIPYDEHLLRLENKYKNKGKRVFVIANGPSLRVSDLDWLHKNHEICISCNTIFKLYDKTAWRPDYYFINDDLDYEDQTQHYDPNFIYDDKAKKDVILCEDIKPHLKYKPDRKKVGYVPVCYLDHWLVRPGRFRDRYSSNIKLVCYDLYTVACSAIAFADFMGFDEIYLLGTDCNYYGSYAHNDGQEIDIDTAADDISQYIEDTELNYMRGFQTVKNECDKEGVRIFNATRGGSLEVFLRVNMDDIIRGEV